MGKFFFPLSNFRHVSHDQKKVLAPSSMHCTGTFSLRVTVEIPGKSKR